MNIIIKSKRVVIAYTVPLVFSLSIIYGQKTTKEFLEYIDRLEVYQSGTVRFDTVGIRVPIEDFDRIFLNYKGKGEIKDIGNSVYYYNGPKTMSKAYSGMDAGGDGYESVFTSYKLGDEYIDTPVSYDDKKTLLGTLEWNKDYYTLLISFDTYFWKNVGIYNYTKKGILLSALFIYENESEPLAKRTSKNVFKRVISSHTMISGKIYDDKSFDIKVQNDQFFIRKYYLDADGHFRLKDWRLVPWEAEFENDNQEFKLDYWAIPTYVIEDKDGYTNMRDKPTAKESEIIKQVPSGQDVVRYNSKTKGNWWYVCDYENDCGYIHKSRIVEQEERE